MELLIVSLKKPLLRRAVSSGRRESFDVEVSRCVILYLLRGGVFRPAAFFYNFIWPLMLLPNFMRNEVVKKRQGRPVRQNGRLARRPGRRNDRSPEQPVCQNDWVARATCSPDDRFARTTGSSGERLTRTTCSPERPVGQNDRFARRTGWVARRRPKADLPMIAFIACSLPWLAYGG